jgi:hypothetical protein
MMTYENAENGVRLNCRKSKTVFTPNCRKLKTYVSQKCRKFVSDSTGDFFILQKDYIIDIMCNISDSV